MKVKYSQLIVDEVIRSRKKGISYGTLSKKFNIAKSTLHYWLSKIEYPKENILISRKNWIKKIQPMGALANHNKRVQRLDVLDKLTKNEVSNNTHLKEVKKALLAIMYWAEGAKGRGDIISFANTDPQMIKLFITLLRESYILDENKFRVRIHLHYYHNELKVKEFWSNLLKVPITQFGKIYRKKRGTNKIFRKNKVGICFVRYNSMTLKEEIMYYARNVANELLSGK